MHISRDFIKPGRSLAVAEHGMVASSHPQATLAGVEVLKRGGNAMDAAVAAVALQGVVEPHMTGIGGDCFVLMARPGAKIVSINGSGAAPASATLEWYLGRNIAKITDDSAHAVTVPGAVSAWCHAIEQYGSLSFDEILQPAIKAAEGGFRITPRVGADWDRFSRRLTHNRAARDFFLPGGCAPQVGDCRSHEALAATLRLVAREGPDGFYTGQVSERLVTYLNSLGGLHSVSDFANHRTIEVKPISAPYREHIVHECAPNGQGIIVLLILQILQCFQVNRLSDVDRIHLLAEATKAAYRFRDCHLGDIAEAFELPISREIEGIARRIRMDGASDPVGLLHAEHKDTVYVSVVDRDRMAVSFINSLFGAFGSGIYEPQTGVLFHNRGISFRIEPGHPNAIGPRKRPMHTIIPGLLSKDGRCVMSFGVMGGHYQACGHAHFISQMLDCGLDPQAAADVPRSFAIDGALNLEATVDSKTFSELSKRGHNTVRSVFPIGGCQAIMVDHDKGVLYGASDYRKDGIALGY